MDPILKFLAAFFKLMFTQGNETSSSSSSFFFFFGGGGVVSGIHLRSSLLPSLHPSLPPSLLVNVHVTRENQSTCMGRWVFTKTHLFSFIRPQSMTNTTSSIVTEVSAMFVDRTIFRTPSFGFLKCAVNGKRSSLFFTGKKQLTGLKLFII